MVMNIIQIVYLIYSYMIIGYILLSWIPSLKGSPLWFFLNRVCEPFLEPFRKVIPTLGVLDISAIVALFTLYFAKEGLLFLLIQV